MRNIPVDGEALAVINMSNASEAQSLPVLILEYVALAGGLLALVGGLYHDDDEPAVTFSLSLPRIESATREIAVLFWQPRVSESAVAKVEQGSKRQRGGAELHSTPF